MEIFRDILGIEPTTDEKKIRRAYSALIKIHNPEDDEEEFKKINTAYKTAMEFARRFAHLEVPDERIKITDVRKDGSIQVRFLDENGQPLNLAPSGGISAPAKAGKERKKTEDTGPGAFEFDDIDTTVVKDLSKDEIDRMAGFIDIAPGFPVPDSGRGRKLKAFIEEHELVKYLGRKAGPDELEQCREDALYTAGLILREKELAGEKILWRFFFLSPEVCSLYDDLSFYIKLEKLINDTVTEPWMAAVISEGSPMRPRSYIIRTRDGKQALKTDFISRVPFRYAKDKYPRLDLLMRNENPEEYGKLCGFLSSVRVNLYGLLMPSVRLFAKEASDDFMFAFNYILTSPDCSDMRENRLLWKLFFKGSLMSPITEDKDVRAALNKYTLEHNVNKRILKLIRKEASFGARMAVKRRKDDREWYYLV